MTEDDTSSVSNPAHPGEPEKTGTEPESQKPGSPLIAILPAARTEVDGLRAMNVADIFSALQNQSGQQMRDILQIVGEGIDRQQERMHRKNDQLEVELRDEKVAHGRTEERLKAALLKSGTRVFLTTLGGALLGFGLRDFGSANGKVMFVVGIIIVAVACWPLLPSSKD